MAVEKKNKKETEYASVSFSINKPPLLICEFQKLIFTHKMWPEKTLDGKPAGSWPLGYISSNHLCFYGLLFLSKLGKKCLCFLLGDL